jgi:lysyl-tRNA synthetase class 2
MAKKINGFWFFKNFEIGRVYRNEGTSPDHLQEFTNMEFYIAYEDYEFGMEFVENLYKYIAINTFGKTEFSTRGHTFNLNDKWKKISYVEEIKKQTGIDVLEATEDEMKEKLNELNVKYTGTNKERLTDTLWKYCRKNISGPAFLIRIPKLVSPLSKACEDDNRLTERFQPILAGSEVGNGFSELNDPIDQRERFNLQQELIERGDDEAMMPEWEFVEMLEHGMPPTFGFGFGERLFAFLVDKPLRETQLFPLMKPKKED